MSSTAYHVGQRLSLKSQPCTVRYIGPVAEKTGEWLGVEWDDAQRGKHDGTHACVSYFQCRSRSPTAGSFLRPDQAWEETRTFLQALKEKYAPEESVNENEIVHVSASKRIEEVGYEKLARRQARLQGIRTLVLDRMRIRHDIKENELIRETCAGVTDLDISGNLFETFDEVLDLCWHFPALRGLTLDANRLTIDRNVAGPIVAKVQTLSLSNTLLNWDMEVSTLLQLYFGGLETVSATNNGWRKVGSIQPSSYIPSSLHALDLSGNEFGALDDVYLGPDASVRTLILKQNNVSQVRSRAALPSWSVTVEELDVRHNAISSWSFIDELAAFPKLKHLRVTGNPLYQDFRAAADESKQLGTEDSYMLTIARLPQLATLNYSKITEKERLNAETYYLNQIVAELAANPDARTSVSQQHPRWTALCQEYGEPTTLKKFTSGAGELNANSLAARLVNISFYTSGRTQSHRWTEQLPKTITIYTLLSIVGKQLGVMPLRLRLMFETGEHDPVGRGGQLDAYNGPEWWDSDDEDSQTQHDPEAGAAQWLPREVHLVAGMGALGTYVEGTEATVRVEVVK